ncbi:MAG: FAD-dependent oxidoreductase [Coriobacteriaceae bacterium]|jgi:succinate dehydrogenase/fumarate reductase flavoprotein subunit|nr:FAD-dependent oxidoreductase [Coriobacteriaceae bacterium]
MQTNQTRRTFLKVGALAGLGALGTGMLKGCSGSQNSESDGSHPEEIVWDGVFDVVVVGFGAAGASAAIAAAEKGQQVLLIDKAAEGSEGGNSRYSSQVFVSAANRDNAFEYYRGLRAGFSTPDEVLWAYVDGLGKIKNTLASWGADKEAMLDITDIDVGIFTSAG